VTGEFFTDRAEEVKEILKAMKQPTRMLIRGPRRQGKTSAMAQAGRHFREEGGILLWADLSTIATFSDLRDRFLSSLPRGFFGVFEGLEKLVPFLEIVIADPSTGAHTYRFRPGTTRKAEPGVREQIRILLESIDRRRKALGKPVVAVLDEVQAILSVNETGADWFLRDLMQSVPDISFLCAGSQPTILEAIWTPFRPHRQRTSGNMDCPSHDRSGG
jgi:AAA+ ATPase superfamily predicted ATPase